MPKRKGKFISSFPAAARWLFFQSGIPAPDSHPGPLPPAAGSDRGNIAAELETAIKSCRTWVSKGPLLLASYNKAEKCLELSVEKSNKSGFDYPEAYQIVLKTVDGDNADLNDTFEFKIKVTDLGLSTDEKIWFSVFENDEVVIYGEKPEE